MIRIPIQDAPAFVETVVLDGSLYRLSFRFNYRGQFWSLGIADSAGNVLLAGAKLVVNHAVAAIHPGRGLPPGLLMVIDTSSIDGTPVDREALGNTARLVYLTEAEREAL